MTELASLARLDGVAQAELCARGELSADELFEMAHFVAVNRPGHTLSTDGLPADRVSQQEIPALAISSSDVRARARGGAPVWYLVPDGGVQYIAKHGLYRGNDE